MISGNRKELCNTILLWIWSKGPKSYDKQILNKNINGARILAIEGVCLFSNQKRIP